MRWEVEPIYELGQLGPVAYARTLVPDDTMTFQAWGIDDPDNCLVVVALAEFEDFANHSPRDVLALLADMSRDSFALPVNWEAVSV